MSEPGKHRLPTTAGRSALMKRIRQEGTTPELRVRRLLSRLGVRYRLNVRGLPGRPDIANQARRKAIFVHGCFWHHHTECGRGTIPKANSAFWASKLERNVERDRRKISALRALGFDVLVIWECALKEERTLLRNLQTFWFGTGAGTDDRNRNEL